MAWVHDRIFAAGGNHLPATWHSFQQQMGITAVLTLNENKPAVFVGPIPKRFLWLDVLEESQAGLEARQLAGAFLSSSVNGGGRVLLHSSHSRHRTRWAFVAFLIYSGKSVAAALRQAAETPWLAPYETDETRWYQLVELLDKSSIGPAA